MPPPQKDLLTIQRTLEGRVWDGTRKNGTSLASALTTVREGYSRFWEPLTDVADRLLAVLSSKSPKTWIEVVGAGARAWSPPVRDAFLLIAGYTTHWHSRWDHQYEAKAAAMSEAMNALATAVGPATDKTVRMRLSAWGYAAAKSLALPKELPTTVEDALALYATLGLTKDTLALGKSAGAAARGLPAPLRAFYAAHGSLGSRTIVREKSLASKTKSLAAWRKIALEDLEDDVDRGTLHPQNLTPKALALGTTSSGDVYFLDVGLDLGTEEPPVFRFSHDEGHSEIVASTLGAFIAGEVLAAAIADGPLASKLERLRAKDRKRIKLPAALAKAPR